MSVTGGSAVAIRKERRWRPPRVLLYGEQKVGKTTWAASARDVVLLGNEEGAEDIEVSKFPEPKNWGEVEMQVRYLLESEHSFRAVALDTLDWLEPLLWRHLCELHRKSDIEAFGYGKGYELAIDGWRKLLAQLDALRERRGMTIIALAHSQVRTFQNPAGPDYDRFELKIHKKASALWCEWVDVIGFAEFCKVVGKDGKAFATNERQMHTAAGAAWVAGTRYQIPSPMPLDWATFAVAVKDAFDSKSSKETSNAA